MATNYQYIYAELDPDTKMCVGVHTGTSSANSEYWIEIPVYDEEYIMKYYIDGCWYEDADGTIPWQSSLL